MLIQRYLRSGKSLDDLKAEFGIDSKVHPTDGRVILNYSQFESPKSDPHVHECRGLVLQQGTWDVVARAFPRFFNYGEMTEVTSKFNWENFTATAKEDGSLMILHYHNGEWKVNTRGSFADYPITSGGMRWDELFWSLISNVQSVNQSITYAFEMCSIWNKVVRYYQTPALYLLGCFQRDGTEVSGELVDSFARILGVKRPEVFSFASVTEIVSHLSKEELDATFEGFVLRDVTGLRLKVKNARYVALHTLKGDGDNLFLTKNLLPLVLKGERDERLAYFPEVAARYDEVAEQVDSYVATMLNAWDAAKHLETQKEFAQTVIPRTKLSAILFHARRDKFNPADKWREYEDLLLKVLQS